MDEQERYSHEVTLKAPFFDLDPMQIVWHGHYLKYFDIARSELFDHLGVDLFAFYDRTRYAFPDYPQLRQTYPSAPPGR